MHSVNYFDIQRSSFVDGPGIRTVLFFKGCNLRCRWCHNPESWVAYPEQAWYKNRCIGCGRCIDVCPNGAVGSDFRPDIDICINCGICVSSCPAAARKIFGQQKTTDELLPILIADKEFFEASGGGVTFSGGECLLQTDTLEELLIGCINVGVQTAVDTAGAVSWEKIERILPHADLVLYDIKCFSSTLHKELTGMDNAGILDNYRRIHERAPEKLIVRIPVIPGVNDVDSEMLRIAEYLEMMLPQSLELLPYHRLGISKAEAVGRCQTEFTEPDPSRMDELKIMFKTHGINVV